MTTRERKLRKAERLQEWADKRQERAAAALNSHPEVRHDWAFITQPGRIPLRERMNRADERAYESLHKAREMDTRAAGILAQLDRAIYSDDPDAIERLKERIAALEAQRDAAKAANAAFRKEHRAELAAMTAYKRDQAMPVQGFTLTNIGAEIRRNRKRLDEIKRAASEPERPLRVIQARREGTCGHCDGLIRVGDYIGKFLDGAWAHVSGTPWTRCTRYIVKCDDCKREIGKTDDLGVSAAGGRCEDCRN